MTPRDSRPSCIISGDMGPETAHVIPKSLDTWYTNNAMCDYSQGAKSASNSENNVCRLRVDLHRIFDNRAFTFVPKLDAEGKQHTVVHFFSTTKDSGDAALSFHNQKVHSLESVAPQFLFARFALTVFAYIKDFVLRGEKRRIAVVQRDIDSNGSPAWLTREVEMDRAERNSRYGGGGSRASSPSKRSRYASESQQGDGQENLEFGEIRYTGQDPWETGDGRAMSRTRDWVQANSDDGVPPPKRQRFNLDETPPPLTTSSASSRASSKVHSFADAGEVKSDCTRAGILSKGDEYNNGRHCRLEGVEVP